MSILIGGIYGDNYAKSYNGTTEFDWYANPNYKTDTAGSFTMWVRFPALNASGTAHIAICAMTSATNSNYIFVSLRRNPGYATYGGSAAGNYIDVTKANSSGTLVGMKSNPTNILANTWYEIEFNSSGNVVVNGVIGTPIKWSTTAYWTGDWFGTLAGTNLDMVFGATRRTGSTFGRYDLNNANYFNRALTAPESLEIYTNGMAFNPRSYTFVQATPAMLKHGYGFENNTIDSYGSENLTQVP